MSGCWYGVCYTVGMKRKFEILENDKNQNIDDFYLRLKEKLEKTHTFPTNYMFKYIIPSEQSVIAKLYSIFDGENISFSTRDSKNGKYIGLTIKVPVNDADDIIIYYRQTAVIEGIMTL